MTGGGKEGGDKSKEDIDLKSIQGNVNYVNVDNLFYDENYGQKLSYSDYQCITEDYASQHLGKITLLMILSR